MVCVDVQREYFLLATGLLMSNKMQNHWCFTRYFTSWCSLTILGSYIPEGLMTSCTWDYVTYTLANRSYTMMLCCFVFFIPLGIIFYCYLFMFLAIRKTGRYSNSYICVCSMCMSSPKLLSHCMNSISEEVNIQTLKEFAKPSSITWITWTLLWGPALSLFNYPLHAAPPTGKSSVWALRWGNPPWSSRSLWGASGSWQRSHLSSLWFMSSPGHRMPVSHWFPGRGKTSFID